MFIRQINGIEDLEEAAADATMDPVQLSRGTVRGELIFAPLKDCVLSYGRYSGDVSISGAFCDHDVTFGILIGCADSTVCSMPVKPGTFGVFPAGFDHQAIYRGGTDYLLFKIAPDTIEAFAEQEGFTLGPRALTTAQIYQPPRLCGRFLCQRARGMVDQLRQNREHAEQRLVARVLRDQLVRLAMTSLASVDVAERRREDRLGNSRKILSEVQEWLHERRGEECAVEDLSTQLGIPRRTLFRAFANEAGMSPARFMKCFRISQVRRELADARHGGRTITSAATEWGFWHLGQFASDYRRIFGELPSETVARGRNPAG